MDPLYYIIPVTDVIVSFAVAYGTYRYMIWKQDQLLKKMHPDEKNGLNVDLSYKIDGQEVFGVHARGVDLADLIDNATRAFSAFTKRKDQKVAPQTGVK